MNTVAIIIPTLDKHAAALTGRRAQAAAGCPTRLIIVNGPPRGFTKTVNEGLRQLQPGEDVCILNDDVTSFQFSWLATLQTVLYKKPHYGIVGPSGKSAAKSREGKPGMRGIEELDQLSFWCVLLKRQMLDEIGILDERFIHYCSDNEYCLRARRNHWRCVWVRGVYLEHKHHGSGLRNDWKKLDTKAYRQMQRTGK